MELAAVAKRGHLSREQIGDLDVRRGTVGRRDVVAVSSGMGTALSARATQRLLDAVAVERVMVVGIAGAVDAATPIAALVRPEVVVHGAAGTEYRPSPLIGEVHAGTLWTDDELITDDDMIDGLRARGVVALDMETAAIAKTCEERGLPWHVFRAVSDRTTDSTLDDEMLAVLNRDGSVNRTEAIRYVVRHPLRIGRLAKFGLDAKHAADAAAEAAIAACTRL
jgi:adenosylhomocysteine nucleosidase